MGRWGWRVLNLFVQKQWHVNMAYLTILGILFFHDWIVHYIFVPDPYAEVAGLKWGIRIVVPPWVSTIFSLSSEIILLRRITMNQVCVCCCCVDWLMSSRATVVGGHIVCHCFNTILPLSPPCRTKIVSNKLTYEQSNSGRRLQRFCR